MPKISGLTRRTMFFGALLLPVFGAHATPKRERVEVWKTPSCGCCKDWITHLEAEGFEVKTYEVSDAAKSAKRRDLGMPAQFGSCHTGMVRGYVLEGHVPASDIRRLLADRPKALGLAVPGMPIGSPGMDGPDYGGRKDPFDVLLVRRDGTSTVFHAHV